MKILACFCFTWENRKMRIVPIDIYCERIDPNFWAEPINAISNISILLGSIFGLFFISKVSSSGGVKLDKFQAYLAGFFGVITSIGSFLFHTFANSLTILMDVIPISLFQITVIHFFLHKVFNLRISIRVISILVFAFISIGLDQEYFHKFFNGSMTYFPSLFMLFGFSYWARAKKELEIANGLLVSGVVFFISLIARSLDMQVCDLFSIGTHFIWHTLNGVLIFVILKTISRSLRN